MSVDYTLYRQVCQNIDPYTIQTFKKNREIGGIIENVSKKYGDDYLKNIESFPESVYLDWSVITLLNDVGSPHLEPFIIQGQTRMLSPTTLRYIYYTLDVLSYIRDCEKSSIDIIEVGGGYGFQSILLCLFSHLFNIQIKSYNIVDLPEANNLQNQYLLACQTSFERIRVVSCNTVNAYTFPKTPDTFLLSNYAMGEFPQKIQDFYVENVAKKTQHGYLCWNFSPDCPIIHPYFTFVSPFSKWEEENPQTNCSPVKSYIVKY
jgi:hypothetical protein